MRRKASDVIKELEMRVAFLEKQSTHRKASDSELSLVLENVLDTIKRKEIIPIRIGGPRTKLGENTYTVGQGITRGNLPQEEEGESDEFKNVSLETFNYASVYLDEATSPNLCSRIKNKDRTLIDELNKFFRTGSNSSKIISALEKRGAKEYVARLLEGIVEYRNNHSNQWGVVEILRFTQGSISQPTAKIEIVSGGCYIHVYCRVENTAITYFELAEDYTYSSDRDDDDNQEYKYQLWNQRRY